MSNCEGGCEYLYKCNELEGVCEHEPLWPPNYLVILAFILLPILIGIGNVGGLGGGITKVPIMMLMMNFPQRQATYQAYCIQFGACISNAILLFFQRHPTKDRPLIDFNIGLILVPVVMLGTTMGIYANDFLPEIATNALFIVFLVCVMPYLFKKSMKLRNEEKIAKEKEEQQKQQSLLKPPNHYGDELNDTQATKEIEKRTERIFSSSWELGSMTENILSPEEEQSLSKKPKAIRTDKDTELIESCKSDEITTEIGGIYALEKMRIPPLKFSIICFSFVIVQFLNLILGTKSINSIFGFARCSVGFWIFLSILPLSIFGLNALAYIMLKKEETIKVENEYDFDKEDFRFTSKNFGKVWASGFCSGFLAGALGAGGGLSMVTFLMALGLKSRVASATTGMNNLFIGLTSILSVILNSSIPASQVYAFTGFSFIGGFAISKIIYYIVNKYNKTSMVVMFVFGFCIINIISNVVYVAKTEHEYGWDPLLSTDSFC